MKTMTCRQLGGTCDLDHHGDSADEVIKAQDRRLREVVVGGDTAHQEALAAMKARWRRPISGMGWYRDVKHRVADLPEDPIPTE
ncbi:MAG: hypothetical protein M0Z95_03955 [Actinomycetota bacterium]|jgi:hypothetical protein|nr:hypothetical protein [Actinomycetota bacterium]